MFVQARTAVLALGLLALGWTAYCLPIFAVQVPAEAVAKRILSREVYQTGTVSALSNDNAIWSTSKWGHPSFLSSQAALNLRFLERSIKSSDTKSLDNQFDKAADSIQRSLSVSPADPLLWIAYFWIENNRRGFRPAHLAYLRMSYATGPSEGWVAITRNRFALALYSVLPANLVEEPVNEFSRLVASRFFDAAIDVLSGQGDKIVPILLGSLKDIDFDDRQTFATLAYRRGYNWNVPGVEKPEWRPWH